MVFIVTLLTEALDSWITFICPLADQLRNMTTWALVPVRTMISPGFSSLRLIFSPHRINPLVLEPSSRSPVTDQYTQLIQPEQSSPFKIRPFSS